MPYEEDQNVQNRLSSQQDLWNATESAGTFEPLPAGTYYGTIKSMIVGLSKKSSRLQVSTTFVISSGEFEGRYAFRHDGLEESNGIKFFKSLCETIGLEIPKDLKSLQSDLNDYMQSPTAKSTWKLIVKVSGEFTNVAVLGRHIDSMSDDDNS